MPLNNSPFSHLADALIKTFEEKKILDTEKKITVNILVSKVASFYEKVRTSMDYGNEETILRRAIERILKRRMFLNANPKSLADDLVRELIWAGYFKDETVPESIINRVTASIGLYLRLKDKIIEKKLISGVDIYEYIIRLLSCEIYVILLPNREREAISNFMFQVLRDFVDIVDDSKQTRDVQVFIAIRKNFARDDLPFLRYRLFLQIFGKLSENNFDQVVSDFPRGYQEMEYQLLYPRKDKIFNHIKKETPPFLILHDILIEQKGSVRQLVESEENLRQIVLSTCAKRYKNINQKVRTAIVRSFVFILFTKAFVALSIEGTFERIFFGSVQWTTIGLNTVLPPILMVLAGLLVKTPDEYNSQAIYLDIHKLLFEEHPQISDTLSVKLKANGARTIKDQLFSTLWILSILLVFGIISAMLTALGFNILSQTIFILFIAIISFLTYRIYQTASTYNVIFKKDIFTPILDFFFVPVIRVGRRLTVGITQINFILIIVDYIIEAPFKALVGFFEQWFSFLATKREELE